MAKSNDLFDLIKSMSKSEKGYFKKYSKKHMMKDGNKYIQLFDLLDRQKEYNEGQIKIKLKGEKMANHLAVARNYLYYMILESLLAFGGNKDTSSDQTYLINLIKVLLNKGLYNNALKIIKRVKKKCYDLELFAELYQVLQLEMSLAGNYFKYYDDLSIFNELNKESQLACKELNNFSHYKSIFHRFFSTFKMYPHYNDSKKLDLLDKLIQDKALTDEALPTNFNSKYYFYTIHSYYNNLKRNFDKKYEFSQKLVGLFDTYPVFKQEYPYRYIVCLNNLIQSCTNNQKYVEARKHIDNLRGIDLKVTKDQANQFWMVHFNLLTLAKEEGISSDFNKLYEESLKGLKIFKDFISDEIKISFYFLFAYNFFSLNKYSDALTYINNILNNYLNRSVRIDIISSALILNLMTHFEKGNMIIMPSLIEQAYNYFSRHNLLFKKEKDIFRLFKGLSASKNKSENVNTFDKYLSGLGTEEIQDYQYINVWDWAKSKL